MTKQISVEYIDDVPVAEGVLASIDALKEKAILDTRIDEAHFINLANNGFDTIERNVESYLDWYYHLPSEYMRIGKFLVGELETYLTERLEQHLQQGQPFTTLNNAFCEATEEFAAVYDRLQSDIDSLINDKTIELDSSSSDELIVIQRATKSEVSTFTSHEDIVNLHQRLYGGPVGGRSVLAALLAKNIIETISERNLFKRGAVALGKAVAGRAISRAGAGAAAGAAVGSIIPGFGTLVGALFGSAVGAITISVGIDAMFLKVQELNSRDDFKLSILECVSKTRAEFTSGLHLEYGDAEEGEDAEA